jgi:hypothetical protein
MAQNIFEELHQKKQNLISMVEKAREFKWFDSDDAKNNKTAEDLIAKINQDTLTIGVIGQMKCGKSTFLNSFVFEDDILPAATTPMTAALSKITYGEQKKIVADFYSTNDWEEQKALAAKSIDGVSELEKSKIQAAQELVEKSKKLGGSLSQYLGKTQEDSFDNLVEYVGADGKFVSITKSVTIYYPKEYLKGVEIVDTPGFNDPIVSREERTKEFLVKADVVVMLLYAGRAFDATDRTILFENVRKCGIGKVLIGINKYDIAYEKGETEDEIKEYVKEELRKASRECGDATLTEILKNTEPIPLSAEMALLSKIAEKDMSKITSNESYKFAWNRHSDNFEISNYKQFAEKSHIDDLISAIKNMIEKEKAEIMFKKPMNAVKAAATKRLEELAKQLVTTENSIVLYNTPDEELDEKRENISKATRRLSKKIEGLAEEIDDEFREIIRTGKRDLEDAMDSTCKKLNSIVDNWGTFQSYDKIRPQIESEMNILQSRTLKRMTEDIGRNSKMKLRGLVRDFFSEAEEIFYKYLPDVDTKELTQKAQRKIEIDIDNDEIFKYTASDNSEGGISVGKVLEGAVVLVLGGLIGSGIYYGIKSAWKHSDLVKKLKSDINNMQSSFKPELYLNVLMNGKDNTIAAVTETFKEAILVDLQNQIEEIQSKKANKEKALTDAQELRNKLTDESAEVKKQMAEMGIEG